MNNEGFTLIELLICIVIFSIIVLICVPLIMANQKKYEDISNDTFNSTIDHAINSYITLKGSNLDYDTFYNDTIKVTHKIEMNKLVEEGLLDENLHNTKKEKCDIATSSFKLGRDDNYKYCYVVEMNCLEEVIDTCKG
ncbi:MAG: type II secretion system protein [bacterium]|nr:type II secretion system protein [bacterium]